MELLVPHVDDFTVTGDGSHPAWNAMPWQPMPRVGGGPATYQTHTKVLYSKTGLYFLVDCPDTRLTCSGLPDFADLYTEDVVEVFLWTDETLPLYFEYEISPLNAELPIIIPNVNGRFHGWLPWHYTGKRKTRTATAVRGGEKAPMATVEGWSTEFFIPYALLVPLANVPPRPGSTWRANIYRIDHDAGTASQWAWCPDTGCNFHDYQRFGTLRFA